MRALGGSAGGSAKDGDMWTLTLMMMMMMTLTVREGGGGWELLVKYGGIRHAYELHFQRWIGEKQDSRALGRVLDARALTFAMYSQSAVFSVCVCVC